MTEQYALWPPHCSTARAITHSVTAPAGLHPGPAALPVYAALMKEVPAPSPYQQAILAELSQPGDHVVIHATAGAGKTTVLVQIARRQPESARQLFLAFARDAATELKRRLPAGVDTRTVHSLGRQVLATHLRTRNIELLPPQPAKYRRLARQLLQELKPELAGAESDYFLSELCGMVRLQLVDAADRSGLQELVAENGLWPPVDLSRVDELFALVPELLERGLSQAERGLIDFGDMLYVPVRKRLPVPVFDLVAVDEAQDYSRLALELTLSLAAAGARLVFVGDPRQSIFGFAGADPDAMQSITDRLAATVLPLSVTYRCPRLHVELAREIAPEMEAAPGAIPGRVQSVSEADLDQWIQPGDLVLCRLNAPLIAVCTRLTALGLPAFVRGAELQERLKHLARRVFSRGMTAPEQQLQAFLSAEQRRLANSELSMHGVAIARLRDEVGCLIQLCRSAPANLTAAILAELIDETFGNRPGTVTLSSIHRAKGQEADRVILLYPELLPAPYARSLKALRGEACVQFVALTRAMKELVLVEAAGSTDQPIPAGSIGNGADAERDRILAAWSAVLSKARSGRRHRSPVRQSTIRRVPYGARRGLTDA